MERFFSNELSGRLTDDGIEPRATSFGSRTSAGNSDESERT